MGNVILPPRGGGHLSREVERQREIFANVTVPPQDSTKMNMLGVSWQVIQNFREIIHRVPVDLSAAATYRKFTMNHVDPDDPTWHTKDICEQLVKPITRRLCSYSELVVEQDPANAGPANVFVSHAWQYTFEQLYSALETFFDSEHARQKGLTPKNTYFWLDVFTVRQRNWEEDQADPKPEGWWMNTFLVAIKNIGHMVMLAAPWQKPLPLTRSWCLFELYACILHKVDFDLLFCQAERAGFADDVLKSHSVIYDNLSQLDVSKAQAWKEADRIAILSLVEKELGGADTVNRRVFELLRQWFQTIIRSEVSRVVGDASNECRKLNGFARALEEFALHEEALELFQRALASGEKNNGLEHPDTLATVRNLADVRKKMGDYDEAHKLYRRALAGNEKTHGSDHPLTLATVNNLAILLRNRGDHDEALKLFQRALVGRDKHIGPDHPDTLQTVENLARLHKAMGNYDKGLELYQRALTGREKRFGPDHPDTRATVKNLTRLNKTIKRKKLLSGPPSPCTIRVVVVK